MLRRDLSYELATFEKILALDESSVCGCFTRCCHLHAKHVNFRVWERMKSERKILMLRPSFNLSCVGVLLLLSFTSCQAQTVSRCRPTPPMPRNPKPGVIGLSLSRDGKTLV